MDIRQLSNRTVGTGSDHDLARFATIVRRARDLPVYDGSIDVGQIRQSGLTSRAAAGHPVMPI